MNETRFVPLDLKLCCKIKKNCESNPILVVPLRHFLLGSNLFFAFGYFSDAKRADQPEVKKCFRFLILTLFQLKPEEKEDDLDATDDGESSQESHGSSNETQLGLELDFLVELDVVEGCRVKVDLNQLKC